MSLIVARILNQVSRMHSYRTDSLNGTSPDCVDQCCWYQHILSVECKRCPYIDLELSMVHCQFGQIDVAGISTLFGEFEEVSVHIVYIDRMLSMVHLWSW